MSSSKGGSLWSRRQLLAGVGALAATTQSLTARVQATGPKPASTGDRRDRAYALRRRAAESQHQLPAAPPVANGDERRIAAFGACYSKGLPHNDLGIVDSAAYQLLLAAIASEDPQHFEEIPLGGFVRLADPQAAYGFDLVGCDSSQLAVPPAPGVDSAEQAGELVELYWHALLRDVPFADYATHPLVAEACADLSRLSDFHGPKGQGRVTPANLFRGETAGDLRGPYLSQFLWKPVPYVPMVLEQRMRVAVPGTDYVRSYPEWLAIQNGALSEVNRFDEQRRYLRTGRDLGEFVHRDFTYQAFLSACLILLKAGTPVDGGNPFKHSRTQSTFSSFGPPFVLALLATATQLALKACWYQKWVVHRRLRPEELAGRFDRHSQGHLEFPLHGDLAGAAVVDRSRRGSQSFLLPQAYPEGSPTHPSYPAGHAAIAGACATVLKAFFDESYVVPQPVVPAADGLSVVAWTGEPLTAGGELDKLASNIAIGRDFAGVHWRSDATAGLRLGEAVALDLLRERKLLSNELFTGFSFQGFDGKRITV